MKLTAAIVNYNGAPFLNNCLDSLLAQSRLRVGDTVATRPVSASELRFAFNNRDKVLVDRIPSLVTFAAGAGAGLVVLLLGLLGFKASVERLSSGS
jgi:hypothetical protein